MEVGKGKHGLVKYRCMRTSSALEGYHQHFVAAQDCRAKSVGPRFANASSRQFNFAWNVRGKSWFRSISRTSRPTRPFYANSRPHPHHLATSPAAIKAKQMPEIDHYMLHLRDMLVDVCRDTPHANTHEMIKGWRRVDTLRSVTVPRGCEEGLLRASEVFVINQQKEKARSRPHSKKSAAAWASQSWGHAAPVDLRNRADMQQALANANALVLPDPRAVTQNDMERVHAQAGLLVMPGTLRKLAANLNGQQRTRELLGANGVDSFRADVRSYGQANPGALQSRVPAQPPPSHPRHPTPLPVPQFGASGPASVVVVDQTTEQPVPAAPTAPAPTNPPAPPVLHGQPTELSVGERRKEAGGLRKRDYRRRQKGTETDEQRNRRREAKSIQNAEQYDRRKQQGL